MKKRNYYADQIPKAMNLSEATLYAKAAGVKLDRGRWIRDRYLKEKTVRP